MEIAHPSGAVFRLKGNQSGSHKYAQTVKFIDYWFSLPKIGLIPHKSSIEPRRMGNLLPGVIMLEINADGEGFRIRLSGTANAARWGFEATDRNYLNFTPPQRHSDISTKFRQVAEHPCGLILNGAELYTSGRMVQTEMILFPMRTNEPGQSILFGLITADPDRDHGPAGDLLACIHYTISATQFINIGAGVPD